MDQQDPAPQYCGQQTIEFKLNFTLYIQAEHCCQRHYFSSVFRVLGHWLWSVFRTGLIDSGSGSNILGWIPIPGSRVFMTENLDKFTAGKFLLYIFWIKNCNLLIPRPPYRTSKLQEAFSPQKRTLALQNMKFLNFIFIFVGYFCPPRSRSGSTDLIESGSGSKTREPLCIWIVSPLRYRLLLIRFLFYFSKFAIIADNVLLRAAALLHQSRLQVFLLWEQVSTCWYSRR